MCALRGKTFLITLTKLYQTYVIDFFPGILIKRDPSNLNTISESINNNYINRLSVFIKRSQNLDGVILIK
jgi:hypothetical protein